MKNQGLILLLFLATLFLAKGPLLSAANLSKTDCSAALAGENAAENSDKETGDQKEKTEDCIVAEPGRGLKLEARTCFFVYQEKRFFTPFLKIKQPPPERCSQS